jgi:hypothetical protein
MPHMSKQPPQSTPKRPREQRLAEALKRNIARRKVAQKTQKEPEKKG